MPFDPLICRCLDLAVDCGTALMKIAIAGTRYVGLSNAILLAEGERRTGFSFNMLPTKAD